MTATEEDDPIPVGSVWREADTGRLVRVIGPGPNSPWWVFCDDPERVPWHCSWADFLVWGRFVRAS